MYLRNLSFQLLSVGILIFDETMSDSTFCFHSKIKWNVSKIFKIETNLNICKKKKNWVNNVRIRTSSPY